MIGGSGPADLILTHGRVQTHDAVRRAVEAIAVRQGRFLAVGTGREEQALGASRTRVVELTFIRRSAGWLAC